MPTGRLKRLAFALLALTAASAHAADLGTLFNTPEERERLDRIRRGEPEAAQQATHEHSRTPTLTGFVKRSDGRNTVWIDGVPMAVGRGGNDALLEPNAVGNTPGSPTLRVQRDRPTR
jgi:hypothetical protein